MESNITTKYCSDCKKTIPISQFKTRESNTEKYGWRIYRHSYCSLCGDIRSAISKEKRHKKSRVKTKTPLEKYKESLNETGRSVYLALVNHKKYGNIKFYIDQIFEDLNLKDKQYK